MFIKRVERRTDMALTRIHNRRREWEPLVKIDLSRGGEITPGFGQQLLLELSTFGFDHYGQAAFIKDDSGIWLKYHGPKNGVVLYSRNTQRSKAYMEMSDLITLWDDLRTFWLESKG
jgi:hypothetical protein